MLTHTWRCDLCPKEKRTARPILPGSWSLFHKEDGSVGHACPEHEEEDRLTRREVSAVNESVVADILREDPRLSDRGVARIASGMGYAVSHVTVVRYRLRLGIPGARERRRPK